MNRNKKFNIIFFLLFLLSGVIFLVFSYNEIEITQNSNIIESSNEKINPISQINTDISNNLQTNIQASEYTFKSNYQSISPIIIENNTDFQNKANHYGWEGNGSLDNPYLIQNFNFTSTNSSQILLSLYSTDLYIIIRNNYFSGGSYSIFCQYTNNIIIEDSYILTPSHIGIFVRDSTNISISNNRIEYSNDTGIYVNFITNSQINNNTILNSRKVGIKVERIYGTIRDIKENLIFFSGDFAIITKYSTLISLSKNVLYNNNKGLFFDYCSYSEISNNTFYNSPGVYLEGTEIKVRFNNFIKYKKDFSISDKSSFMYNYWDDYYANDVNLDGYGDTFHCFHNDCISRMYLDYSPHVAIIPIHDYYIYIEPKLFLDISNEFFLRNPYIYWSEPKDTRNSTFNDYSLFYSDDNGMNWVLISENIKNRSYLLDRNNIPDMNCTIKLVTYSANRNISIVFSPFLTIHLKLPAPKLISPFRIIRLMGSQPIRWEPVNDSYGHEIKYKVFYSPDNGETWILRYEGNDTTYIEQLQMYSGGGETLIPNSMNGRLKIIAYCENGASGEFITYSFIVAELNRNAHFYLSGLLGGIIAFFIFFYISRTQMNKILRTLKTWQIFPENELLALNKYKRSKWVLIVLLAINLYFQNPYSLLDDFNSLINLDFSKKEIISTPIIAMLIFSIVFLIIRQLIIYLFVKIQDKAKIYTNSTDDLIYRFENTDFIAKINQKVGLMVIRKKRKLKYLKKSYDYFYESINNLYLIARDEAYYRDIKKAINIHVLIGMTIEKIIETFDEIAKWENNLDYLLIGLPYYRKLLYFSLGRVTLIRNLQKLGNYYLILANKTDQSAKKDYAMNAIKYFRLAASIAHYIDVPDSQAIKTNKLIDVVPISWDLNENKQLDSRIKTEESPILQRTADPIEKIKEKDLDNIIQMNPKMNDQIEIRNDPIHLIQPQKNELEIFFNENDRISNLNFFKSASEEGDERMRTYLQKGELSQAFKTLYDEQRNTVNFELISSILENMGDAYMILEDEEKIKIYFGAAARFYIILEASSNNKKIAKTWKKKYKSIYKKMENYLVGLRMIKIQQQK